MCARNLTVAMLTVLVAQCVAMDVKVCGGRNITGTGRSSNGSDLTSRFQHAGLGTEQVTLEPAHYAQSTSLWEEGPSPCIESDKQLIFVLGLFGYLLLPLFG